MLAGVHQSMVCVGEAEPWYGLGPGTVSSSSRQQNMICSNFCLFVLHITVLHHAAHTRHTDTELQTKVSEDFTITKKAPNSMINGCLNMDSMKKK